MDKNPQTYAFIGLGALAAVAIVISLVRGHFEKRESQSDPALFSLA
jgi:hypothetical protein